MPWDDKIGRRLKLKDLQTLMAVIEAGGIGKAADRLNYSQPAVSKAIASLERTLGKRLFERGRKGIELTPYGDAMLKCGIAVFDDLRKGVEEIDFLADPTAGEVRIACTEPVSAGIVSAVIDRLVRRYPRIDIDVVSRATPDHMPRTRGAQGRFRDCADDRRQSTKNTCRRRSSTTSPSSWLRALNIHAPASAASSLPTWRTSLGRCRRPGSFITIAPYGCLSRERSASSPHRGDGPVRLYAHDAGRRRPVAHDRPGRDVAGRLPGTCRSRRCRSSCPPIAGPSRSSP